jgi:hypothetical protein
MKGTGYNPMANYKNPDQAMYNAAVTPAVSP